MRTLMTLLATAALLVGTSAGAAQITLDVLDAGGNSSGLGGAGMQVQITLDAVQGGGLRNINFDVESDGVVSNYAGFNFSGLTFLQGAINSVLWSDAVGGPVNLAATTVLTFDLAGGTEVDLWYPDGAPGGLDTPMFATDDSGGYIYDIVINPYTVVPEPTTAALLGLGLFGLALGGRRR